MSTIYAFWFLLLASPANSQVDAGDILQLRQQAEDAYANRDAARAEELFLQLTELFPDDPEPWYGLSRAYEWSDELDRAIGAAEVVQQLGYTSKSFLAYRLARLNGLAGHKDAALDWIETALQDGYEDRPQIQFDDAFAGLRSDSRFAKLAAILPSEISGRTAGLRFDVDYLVEEARRMHGSAGRQAFGTHFAEQAKSLRDAIPDLGDVEVLGGMMRLLAILGDGHTGIYGPDPDSPLQFSRNRLPLKFYWFREGIYVVDGVGTAEEFAGSRVLKIGELTPEETLQRMSVYRGVDNPMTWKWMGPQFYLGQMWLLQVVGAANSVDAIDLTFRDANDNTSVRTIAAGDYAVQRKLRPSPAATGDLPLYLGNVGVEQWMQSFPDQATVYFQFNQVRNGDVQSIADFADSLATRLEDDGASTLIVDVRHNNGGNNSLVLPLVKTMVGFEQTSWRNRIYVITGRNTFSAAQNFINRVERWTDAVFVGEPSSSRPNFVGEETNLLLPYSRIRGSISTRYWQDSDPGDNRVWISPDVPIEATAADYFSGRDAALEAIFELVSVALDAAEYRR